MNNKEKNYLLKECVRLFCCALNYNSIIFFEKAKTLKGIIEMFIECQDKRYYKNYNDIVRLYNIASTRNYSTLIKR